MPAPANINMVRNGLVLNMRFPIAWPALALIVTCAFALAFAFTFTLAFTATSEMDIDYSHSVVGTGTLITDYHMGDKENSEASGRVRGTGNLMNKYLFVSGNDSQNVTVEDEFVLSNNGNSSVPTMPEVPASPAVPAASTMDPLPARQPKADGFRLTGAAWAEKLEVMSAVNSSVNASNSSPIDSSPSNSSLLNNSQLSVSQLKGISFPIAGKVRLNLTGNIK
jgi:hypothetical protein